MMGMSQVMHPARDAVRQLVDCERRRLLEVALVSPRRSKADGSAWPGGVLRCLATTGRLAASLRGPLGRL